MKRGPPPAQERSLVFQHSAICRLLSAIEFQYVRSPPNEQTIPRRAKTGRVKDRKGKRDGPRLGGDFHLMS
jgi:hypothetical protein